MPTELIGKINANTIIVGVVNTLLSIMSRSYRDSIRKDQICITLQTSGPNRHIQDIPSKCIINTHSSQVHTELFLQSHVRPQNKSQQMQEDRNYIKYLFQPQWYDTGNQ